jgi:phosphodiesterase/alkaline phosphatase D-like protein
MGAAGDPHTPSSTVQGNSYWQVCSVNRLLVTLGIAGMLEIAHDDLAIIRWTTTNPGGDDDHFAVIQYGTDPNDLSQTTKNHIRLNRAHPETIFRVRMDGLKPQTTYYYNVTSMGSGGESDGVESSVNHFTTAAPGQVTSAFPPQ